MLRFPFAIAVSLLTLAPFNLALAIDDEVLPPPPMSFTLPTPAANAFTVTTAFGPSDGLLYVWNGASILKQDAPLSSSFTSIGSVGSGSADAGPLAFSRDGSRLLAGNGFGGEAGGAHADLVFAVAAGGGDSNTPVATVPFHGTFLAAPLGASNSKYFVNQGNDLFTGSSVSVLDELDGTNVQIIENIPGASTSMALSAADRLFVGVGFGAQRGQLRSFALADLEAAYGSATPLDWTSGQLFNDEDNNSGFGMFFDARGFLLAGGPNGVTVFDTAGVARLYDNSGFTSIDYDPVNDLVLVSGFGDQQGVYPASLFQVPEPSGMVLAVVAAAAIAGWGVRRRG